MDGLTRLDLLKEIQSGSFVPMVHGLCGLQQCLPMTHRY